MERIQEKMKNLCACNICVWGESGILLKQINFVLPQVRASHCVSEHRTLCSDLGITHSLTVATTLIFSLFCRLRPRPYQEPPYPSCLYHLWAKPSAYVVSCISACSKGWQKTEQKDYCQMQREIKWHFTGSTHESACLYSQHFAEQMQKKRGQALCDGE